MKKISKYILAIVAGVALISPAFAQSNKQRKDNPAIETSKRTTEQPDGTYVVDIETYVTGEAKTVSTVAAADIVLVLDRSSSMKNNRVSSTKHPGTTAVTNALNKANTYYLFANGDSDVADGYYFLKYNASKGGWVYSTNENLTTIKGVLSESESYTPSGNKLVVYPQVTESNVTRYTALKYAADWFVKTIYTNRPVYPTTWTGTKLDHRVAIVSYDGNAATNCELTNLASIANVNTVIGKIPENTGNGTSHDRALTAAYNILNVDNVIKDGRNKIVVFFTDGEPYRSGSDRDAIAREAVNAAYNIKDSKFTNTIKADGKTTDFPSRVFSVALLNEDESGGDWKKTLGVRRLMHYVSSNYNFKVNTEGRNLYNFSADIQKGYISAGSIDCTIQGYTSHGSETSHDYYFLTSGADLSSIFAKIADSASDTPGVQIDASSSMVYDVISDQFKLPDGADEDDVTAYIVKAVVNNKTNEVRWETAHTEFGGTISVNKDTKEISVSGYDFSGNYVHPIWNEAHTEIQKWAGSKLVLSFPIEVDPSNIGGTSLPTNRDDSGLYVKKGTAQEECMEEFEIPTVNLPYVKIVKEGLNVGESATFKITKVKDINGTALGVNDEKYTNTVILTRTGNDKPFIYVKLLKTGFYKVEELGWSWTYGTAETQIKEFTHGTDDLIYTFSNTRKENLPKHAEAAVINNMKTGAETPVED